MRCRVLLSVAILPLTLLILSCSMAKQRMPREVAEMHSLLTRNNPSDCQQYHYNAQKEIPRLYAEQQIDSILDVIDYITGECGPNPDFESARLLIQMGQGKFGDSLIGFGTIGQLLWFRAQHDYGMFFNEYGNLTGRGYPIDNTAERFGKFMTEQLSAYASQGAPHDLSVQALSAGFGGNFDSGFALIQRKEMNGTALRKAYDSYIARINRNLAYSGHFSFAIGSWNPQGANHVWGSHPDFMLSFGAETPKWRADLVMSYRSKRSADPITVVFNDSLIQTSDFGGFLIGAEGGLKIFDQWLLSTDVFVGLAYDVITTYSYEDEYKNHGSPNLSVGIRQRVFLGKRSGWYLGGIAKYSLVNYGNSGGTDIGGNTATLSIALGYSGNVTRSEFYKKLNYQKAWRP